MKWHGLNILLNTAYQWICKRKAHTSANIDCGHVHFYWQRYREKLLKQCRHHQYSFSPLQQYRFEDVTLSFISHEESLVLKVISRQLT
jgi:RNA-directed DNA polymerase